MRNSGFIQAPDTATVTANATATNDTATVKSFSTKANGTDSSVETAGTATENVDAQLVTLLALYNDYAATENI